MYTKIEYVANAFLANYDPISNYFDECLVEGTDVMILKKSYYDYHDQIDSFYGMHRWGQKEAYSGNIIFCSEYLRGDKAFGVMATLNF